jgi:hypothetical protein
MAIHAWMPEVLAAVQGRKTPRGNEQRETHAPKMSRGAPCADTSATQGDLYVPGSGERRDSREHEGGPGRLSFDHARRAVRRLQPERHAGHSRTNLELAGAAFTAPNRHPSRGHQIKR